MNVNVRGRIFQLSYICFVAKRKRPTDINQRAKLIVDILTKQKKEEDPNSGKDPAAVALGRKGGLKGGKARAAKLTAEQRKEISKKAIATRWGKK